MIISQFYTTDLQKILNIDTLESEAHIPFIIMGILNSQEPSLSSKPQAMSFTFENFLYAFKLNIFEQNYVHSFLRAYVNHPNHNESYLS